MQGGNAVRLLKLLLKAVAFVVLDPDRAREPPPGRPEPYRPPRKRRCPICFRQRSPGKRGPHRQCIEREVAAGD
jgi:hypothetical protein